MFLETLREVGGIGEPYHVTDFTDGVFPFLHELGGLLETHHLDHFVGGDLCQCLDLGKQAAATDVQLSGEEVYVQF